jgi:23S rRNA (cytosine1962-C5)-methyltransferase
VERFCRLHRGSHYTWTGRTRKVNPGPSPRRFNYHDVVTGDATALFRPEMRRRLVLRAGRERAVEKRHPWIFSGAIAHDEGSDDAAIAELFDGRGRFLAAGFYSSASQIRLRAIAFDEPLDEALVRARIRRAIAARAPVVSEATSAVRLVNAEGDGLSGLVVDRYGEVLVVEITSAGLERLRPWLVSMLTDELSVSAIYFKNAIPARKLEGISLEDTIEGDLDDPIEMRENGLRFLTSPRAGQKTGFFLDQRESRALARRLASGRRVLNLFSYSGGFGVYARSGGAASVEEVDISSQAIELARRNHSLNFGEGGVDLVAADAFDHTRALVARGAAFDLLVCDPPAFAKSRREIDRAARGYKDINLQALKLAAPGALFMTFSCSGHISLDLFQKVVFAAAADSGKEVALLARLGAGVDHPVSLYCPEGEYLKGFLLRVG